MKQKFIVPAFFFLLCLAFVGCKKDSTTDEKNRNYFKVDGMEYEISNGLLVNYGSDGSVNNIELDLFSSGITIHEFMGLPDSVSGNGHGIIFNMFSSSADKLTVGDYVYNNSDDAGSYDDAEYVVNWNTVQEPDDVFISITTGTVRVIKSGSEYELSFSGKDNNDKTILVYYKGSLKYYSME